MTDRRWLLLTLLCTALSTLGIAGVNARIDLFGVFRDPTGRALRVYGDVRVAKYLLSYRYVGANFDGVLVGSSMTGNWNLGPMRSARLYNESVEAGNIVEEGVLLSRVLADAEHPPKMVLMTVHPYLTGRHRFETVAIGPREWWGALGSLNLIDAYKQARHPEQTQEFADIAGSEDYGEKAQALNADLKKMFQPGTPFAVDSIADERYFALVREVQARGIPIVFIVPPTFEGLLAPKQAEFQSYVHAHLAALQPQDRVIDFSSAEFASFRRDGANFSDGVHLLRAGAKQVVGIIDDRIAAWQADGWAATPARPAARQ